jgi:hypothetical protein
LENGLFLLKWLTLAYVVETIMIAYIPAKMIASVLGGTGFGPILMGALVGAPAYLNGYAAVPLVDALLAQGISQGAAMSFVIAGGVSCIPAAIAVWALVKPRIFAAYLGFAITGAMIAGVSGKRLHKAHKRNSACKTTKSQRLNAGFSLPHHISFVSSPPNNVHLYLSWT